MTEQTIIRITDFLCEYSSEFINEWSEHSLLYTEEYYASRFLDRGYEFTQDITESLYLLLPLIQTAGLELYNKFSPTALEMLGLSSE